MDWHGHTILAPLTKGGNLPFRRLCVEFGARVTMSEMAYARQVCRRSPTELALLRRHPSEIAFGVQLAAAQPEEAIEAAKAAIDRGATFVDVNAGCPIHDVVRRGMGATLLRRPAALVRLLEAMVAGLSVPVTVKIRLGWCAEEVNAAEIVALLQDVGVAAIGVHGRTREQRYSKAADWHAIAALVAQSRVPILGNGDILTHYEARWRRAESGCASVMVGRGALMKPWLFQEVAEDREWLPTAEERVAVYLRFIAHMKEHFGNDAKGKKKAMFFLPWHMGFFCRYRPLPEAQFGDAARAHPLLQTRQAHDLSQSPLELILRDARAPVHAALAEELWESTGLEDALVRLASLVQRWPASDAEAVEIATAHG